MENTTNKTPTALELLKSNHLLIENDKTCEAHTHLVVKQMIEFAKLHVQAALESVVEKGQVEVVIIPNDQPSSSFGDDYTYIVDKQSILNAYPLDNIK